MLDLKKIRLFSGLSPEDVEGLQSALHVRKMAAGSRIFNEGDPVLGFYVVQKGAVKIFKTSPRGQEQVLGVMAPGQTFAEAAVFMGGGYPASTECLEDCEPIFVERDAFVRRLRSDPDLALRMMAGIALKRRRIRLPQRFLSLSAGNAIARLSQSGPWSRRSGWVPAMASPGDGSAFAWDRFTETAFRVRSDTHASDDEMAVLVANRDAARTFEKLGSGGLEAHLWIVMHEVKRLEALDEARHQLLRPALQAAVLQGCLDLAPNLIEASMWPVSSRERNVSRKSLLRHHTPLQSGEHVLFRRIEAAQVVGARLELLGALRPRARPPAG